MKGIRILAAVVLFGVVLLGVKQAVMAGDSEYTGADYYDAALMQYGTERWVTDPSAPGPEVVFYMDSVSPDLLLGTWNCVSGYDGPLYNQYQWSYNTVAYFGSPRKFCVVSWGAGSSGSFSGTLYWD
jgi:hypothetical protein